MLQLKPSQLEAIDLLYKKKKAFLTNNCGSGKTLIALGLAKRLKLPALVVCSKSKKIDWINEGAKINYDNYTVFTYNDMSRIRQNPKYNYSDLKNRYRIILLDESQNIGDYTTKKGRAILNLCAGDKHVVFISATPVRNKPTNVYWPLKICGALPNMTKDDFRIRYCGAYILKYVGHLVDGKTATNVTELKEILDNNSVYTSVADRKLTINKHIINFNFNIDRYVKVKDKDGKYIKKDNVPAFEETSKDRKIIGVEKFKVFKHFAKKRGLPKRVVFFTHHRDITIGLAKFLKCGMIIGGMTGKQRDKVITDFNNKVTNRIVISLKSGSEGINVFNCYTCYFIELDFSPTVYRQAYQRLAREHSDMVINAYFFKVLNEHSTIVNEYKDFLLDKLEEK